MNRPYDLETRHPILIYAMVLLSSGSVCFWM